MDKSLTIIAEVKTQSPFGYKAEIDWEDLFDIATEMGDVVSIHVDKGWGGSLERLKYARAMTKKPILAKGYHTTDDAIQKSIDCGADYVLVVGRVPMVHLDKVLVEPYTLRELTKLPKGIMGVWNSRDLKTGNRKKQSFDEARKAFNGWLCQASLVRKMRDVHSQSDAVIIGTHLVTFTKEYANKHPKQFSAHVLKELSKYK